MPKLKLNLLAKDFKNARFSDQADCPIARMAKEHFETDLTEHVDRITLKNDVSVRHTKYGIDEFMRDYKKAEKANFSEHTVVRRIFFNNPEIS